KPANTELTGFKYIGKMGVSAISVLVGFRAVQPANYLLFYWVQGYVSAANFLLLNEYHNYVDMNGVQVATILKLVVDHCKAHPNDKPISAIDKFIRDAKKVEVDKKEVFNPWPQ